jgi:hypothetical protein
LTCHFLAEQRGYEYGAYLNTGIFYNFVGINGLKKPQGAEESSLYSETRQTPSYIIKCNLFFYLCMPSDIFMISCNLIGCSSGQLFTIS